jgi:hypothetical protein
MRDHIPEAIQIRDGGEERTWILSEASAVATVYSMCYEESKQSLEELGESKHCVAECEDKN